MVVVVALALALAAMTLTGFAAGLGGVTARTLGAGGAVVSACDTNGLTVSYTTASSNVTGVTVAGIADPGCEGGSLSLTLVNGTTSVGSGGSVTVPTDGDTADNSVTVAVSPQPAASQVNRIDVSIVGP